MKPGVSNVQKTATNIIVQGWAAYLSVAASSRAPTFGQSRSWRRRPSTWWTLGFVLVYGSFSVVVTAGGGGRGGLFKGAGAGLAA